MKAIIEASRNAVAAWNRWREALGEGEEDAKIARMNWSGAMAVLAVALKRHQTETAKEGGAV